MQISDVIADLLTRIRNAATAKHATVDVPASNVKKAITQILTDEGYVKSFQVIDDGKQGIIRITLKYDENRTSVISGLRRISKPGLRIYSSCADMPKVRKGLGIVRRPESSMSAVRFSHTFGNKGGNASCLESEDCRSRFLPASPLRLTIPIWSL